MKIVKELNRAYNEDPFEFWIAMFYLAGMNAAGIILIFSL